MLSLFVTLQTVEGRVSLRCQTVPLRGVNDDLKVMMKLMRELLKARDSSRTAGAGCLS